LIQIVISIENYRIKVTRQQDAISHWTNFRSEAEVESLVNHPLSKALR